MPCIVINYNHSVVCASLTLHKCRLSLRDLWHESYMCDTCSRACWSRIDLFSHSRHCQSTTYWIIAQSSVVSRDRWMPTKICFQMSSVQRKSYPVVQGLWISSQAIVFFFAPCILTVIKCKLCKMWWKHFLSAVTRGLCIRPGPKVHWLQDGCQDRQ